MKFNVSKNELLNAINIVSKAVSTRTTLPILECILIEAKNNKLKLTGNDLEIAIKTEINADVEVAGLVAIDAKIFGDIIRKLPDNKVVFDINNNIVKITCENCEFKIPSKDGMEYPVIPTVEKENSYKLNKILFKNMIKTTLFSVALEETKPILTGALFEYDQNKLTVVTCDGYRVSHRVSSLNGANSSFKIVIPGKTLNEINKIIDEEDEEIIMFITDNHILIEFNDTVVVSRLLEGEYFNYKQSLTSDFETQVTVNKSNLLLAIERASLLSRDSKKSHIKMNIDNNKIFISSNSEMGNVNEEVNAEIKGKGLEIGFNPKYLIDALKVIDDENITINYTSSLSPCIIEGRDYKYLIMAIRLA